MEVTTHVDENLINTGRKYDMKDFRDINPRERVMFYVFWQNTRLGWKFPFLLLALCVRIYVFRGIVKKLIIEVLAEA